MKTLMSLVAVAALVAGGTAKAADAVAISVTSKIDKNSPGADWNVIVNINYTADGPRQIQGNLFDQNSNQLEWLGVPTLVLAGAGVVSYTYKVPKASVWGAFITAGAFNSAAAVTVYLSDTSALPPHVNLSDPGLVMKK